jgi:two-component system chemotaxis response regulator CheB
MNKTRVLIVDDSVVVRRLLSELIAGDPALESVGTSPNGKIALAKIPQVNPDVVTLDLEMPEMDGLETLVAIRKDYPRLPVVMLSRYTQRGAATTIDALALGATDYVSMPDHATGRQAILEILRQQLLPRIKLFGARRSSGNPPAAAEAGALRSRTLSEFRQRVEIVVIGASTGGPNALTLLLPIFPATFQVPIAIVQHMPPIFTKHLADRLTSKSAISVSEGVVDGLLQPGHAWMAPGDYHMSVMRNGTQFRIKLDQGPEENSCRPAADVLFRSAAQAYGPGVLGVVLTGMGKDGLRGCETIRDAGGQVLAQDEASSVVWGMPGFVAKAGLAHDVLPLDNIGAEIVRRVARGRTLSSAGFAARTTC